MSDQRQLTMELNDGVQFPHRQLTNAEWDMLFIDLSDQVRDFYQVLLANARAKKEEVKRLNNVAGDVVDTDVAKVASQLQQAHNEIENIEIEQETAHVILAYLAGQRSGLRMGLKLLAPRLADMMVDNALVDELISELVVRGAKLG